MNDVQMMMHMASLLESAEVMVAIYDAEDRLRYANQAFRQAWFIDDGEQVLWSDLMRRNHRAGRGTVITAADFDAWLFSTRSRRGKSGKRAFETDLHDGRWLWMTETTNPDGWMLCVATEITSIRSDERALRQDRDLALKASQTDDLTGLPSRRFVMARLHDLLRANGAAGEPVGCLAVLDIDNFKYINDRFGHAFGDAVLKDFAATTQSLIRKTDVLGRVGGEEFVLILPGTRAGDAQAIVERMLDTVRHSRPLPSQASFRYTFSAGIACAARGEDRDDVYRRADLALYAAKMRGRDQLALDPSARVLGG